MICLSDQRSKAAMLCCRFDLYRETERNYSNTLHPSTYLFTPVDTGVMRLYPWETRTSPTVRSLSFLSLSTDPNDLSPFHPSRVVASMCQKRTTTAKPSPRGDTQSVFPACVVHVLVVVLVLVQWRLQTLFIKISGCGFRCSTDEHQERCPL